MFRLFPKDFLRAYGPATQDIGRKRMKKILKPYTCELLRRPGIGISEFAQTIGENEERVREMEKICSPEQQLRYLGTLKKLKKASRSLNTLAPQNKEEIPANVRKTLGIVSRENVEEVSKTEWNTVDNFMHLGASMFLVGIHCQALRTWTTNPKWVKETALTQRIFDKDFKGWCDGNGDMRDLMKVVTKQLKRGNKSGALKDSVYDREDSSDDTSSSDTSTKSSESSEGAKASKGKGKKKKKKTNKKKTKSIFVESESNDEEETKRTKRGKVKRRIRSESSHSESSQSESPKKKTKKTKKKAVHSVTKTVFYSSAEDESLKEKDITPTFVTNVISPENVVEDVEVKVDKQTEVEEEAGGSGVKKTRKEKRRLRQQKLREEEQKEIEE